MKKTSFRGHAHLRFKTGIQLHVLKFGYINAAQFDFTLEYMFCFVFLQQHADQRFIPYFFIIKRYILAICGTTKTQKGTKTWKMTLELFFSSLDQAVAGCRVLLFVFRFLKLSNDKHIR